MFAKNKKMLLITSLLTLLPIPVGLVLMNRFPDTMAIHWGITGQADGFASPMTAILLMPLIMLATQWLLVLVARLDKSNHDRNDKVQKLVLWIMPMLSNLCCYSMYALALGLNFSPSGWMMVFMGILFAVIGNYMPKTRMNATIGIKIRTTYSSEENWNATHRLAGRLWMAGGITMVLLFWLPGMWAPAALFTILAVMVLIPMVYSHRIYKREKAEGKELKTWHQNTDPRLQKISKILLPLLLIFFVVIMFCGNIQYEFQEDRMLVKADFYTDYVLRYENIDTLEYRDGNMPGSRVGGFGSPRLLLGWFENQELGTHVRYTYGNPGASIVVTAGNTTLVFSDKDAESTYALYETLLSKIQ